MCQFYDDGVIFHYARPCEAIVPKSDGIEGCRPGKTRSYQRNHDLLIIDVVPKALPFPCPKAQCDCGDSGN